MFYLPSLRRWLSLTLILLILVLALRFTQRWFPSQHSLLQSVIQGYAQRDLQLTSIDVTAHDISLFGEPIPHHVFEPSLARAIPPAHPIMKTFTSCSTNTTTGTFNPYIQHFRLPNIFYGISLTPPEAIHDATQRFFNPAIIPLPHWSTTSSIGNGARYILVSRLVTAGFHQESHICLADICSPSSEPHTRPCTKSDTTLLGTNGGLRCTTAPMRLNIPPTPAQLCTGAWTAFPDIPGFHDPRVFWSGKGEPLILVNSASSYGCVGLWMLDLRSVYPPLAQLLSRSGSNGDQAHDFGSLMSYPHLTELTRNPRSRDPASIEKNWLLWFPGQDEAYVQYDLLGHPGQNSTSHGWNGTNTTERTGGRTFAKLVGNGFTTLNLTHPDEQPCFAAEEYEKDKLGNHGHWHQGSNSLRLIMCTRAQARKGKCDQDDAVEDGRSVHFAIMHRKFSNEIDLPLRYERYIVVWESRPPFQILGVSRWPLLMHGEKARPWTEDENFPDKNETAWNAASHGKILAERMSATGSGGRKTPDAFRSKAYFTYTPSLSWTWRPRSAGIDAQDEIDEEDIENMSQLGVGYLGDHVLVGIGLDDVSQAFGRVKVDDLLQCLRSCPGVRCVSEM